MKGNNIMKDHEIDEHLHNLNEAEILTYEDMIRHCNNQITKLKNYKRPVIAGRYTEEELDDENPFTNHSE
jgi:hypothetical protein